MRYNTRSSTQALGADNNNIMIDHDEKKCLHRKFSLCATIFKNVSGVLCLMMFSVVYYANKAFMYVWKIGGIYIIWCSLHHATSQLYAYYCTPYTIWGFIAAPFMIATPQCTGLRWCITHGAETIIGMWLVLGTWFVQKLGGYSLT